MPRFWKDQSKGLVIGLSGGFFGGLAGLGGGIIMIPLMYWTLRLRQHEAHGTSLTAIVFTSLIGSIIYLRNGSADWMAALILAASAMITARFGALYAHSLPERRLKRAFAWFVIFISLLVISKGTILKLSFQAGPFGHYVVLIVTGIFTGFLAGMMGVGGGSLMIPSLVICIGMPQHLAQGTSLLAMLPGSAIGAFTHYRLGNVVTRIAFGMILGAASGGYLGASLAHLMPELYLRMIFAAAGIWMGIRYLRET
jgi:uncharacterized membrane protein YfcA